jgi:hypothetical protein
MGRLEQLVQINREYESIMYSDLPTYQKDIRLAELMTEMEKEFNIEKENKAIIALYRKVSNSRGLN